MVFNKSFFVSPCLYQNRSDDKQQATYHNWIMSHNKLNLKMSLIEVIFTIQIDLSNSSIKESIASLLGVKNSQYFYNKYTLAVPKKRSNQWTYIALLDMRNPNHMNTQTSNCKLFLKTKWQRYVQLTYSHNSPNQEQNLNFPAKC